MSDQWSGPLERMDAYRWRIPQSYRDDMRCDGVVYANQELIESMRADKALEQLANVATLPGIQGSALAMPDAHLGYGFPIGGVAAMDAEEGVISPGGVGYDINCGVRLIRSDLSFEELAPHLQALTDALYAGVPSGVGKGGAVNVTDRELRAVARRGAQWAVEHGFGWSEDVERSEERGCLQGADADATSETARRRGRPQLGTLGSGNHFLEIQVVDEVLDPQTAAVFGIHEPGQVMVMIHTGSRGFGYQICDDSLKDMQVAVRRHGIELADRQLACVPLSSPEAEQYLTAMRCAANYAWTNRQFITHNTRAAFEKVFEQSAESLGLHLVYDVCHNIAKLERHRIDEREMDVYVHRKGATRAFGPGRPEVPEPYREVGQPVLVPGDMGSCSYVLVGTERAMHESFGSCCHGAGRQMSRNRARRESRHRDIRQELQEQGIYVRAQSRRTVDEEAPFAYKDVSAVVESCAGAGLAGIVARLRPVGVVKG